MRSNRARLGVGVVGLGAMGRRHAELVKGLDSARLVAIADPSPDRSTSLALELDTRTEPDAEALLRRKDIDALVIATPVETHCNLVQMAASYGKDVLCEKPLGGSIEECETAVSACARTGVRLTVGFMRRYDPAYRRAHKDVQSGRIGKPTFIRAVSRDAAPPDCSYFTSAAATNLFLESAVHDFDLARWLLREEGVEVCAVGAMVTSAELADVMPMDLGIATVRFAGGAMVSIENFKSAGYGYDMRTEIVGTDGALFVGKMPTEGGRSGYVPSHDAGMPQSWVERFATAYGIQMQDWVDRTRTNQPPAISGEDGLRATAIAEAAERSRVAGCVVPIDG